MKILISILFIVAGAFASAMEVTVKCTPKAYGCYNGPAGPECKWADLGEGLPVTVVLNQTLHRPEVWRGRYQTNLEGHFLTLDFVYNEDLRNRPLRVNAFLATATVMAETTGTNSVEIALRNNTYGRGFTCNQIRVIN